MLCRRGPRHGDEKCPGVYAEAKPPSKRTNAGLLSILGVTRVCWWADGVRPEGMKRHGCRALIAAGTARRAPSAARRAISLDAPRPCRVDHDVASPFRCRSFASVRWRSVVGSRSRRPPAQAAAPRPSPRIRAFRGRPRDCSLSSGDRAGGADQRHHGARGPGGGAHSDPVLETPSVYAAYGQVIHVGIAEVVDLHVMHRVGELVSRLRAAYALLGCAGRLLEAAELDPASRTSSPAASGPGSQ